MRYVALLSPVPFESEKILSFVDRPVRQKIAGKTVYRGTLSEVDVVLMNSGIGKVNAAQAATAVIGHFPLRHVVHFGTGGAYPSSGLYVGDVAFATKEIYGDEGIIGPDGWQGMHGIGIPLVKSGRKSYFNEFSRFGKLPLPDLNRKAVAGFRKFGTIRFWAGLGDFKIQAGTFVTVSAASGTAERAVELEERFHAICENMEGAAVAHVCALSKIPLIELRGISNVAGIRDKSKWDLKLASSNCQRVVLEAIKNL